MPLRGLDFTCDNYCVGLDGCTFSIWHWSGNQCPLAHLWDPNSACKSTLTTNLSAGGHLNPAVTFAMCFLAREPWIKLPIYALAQTLGAFLGAGIVFGLYYGKCRNLVCLLGWDYCSSWLTAGRLVFRSERSIFLQTRDLRNLLTVFLGGLSCSHGDGLKPPQISLRANQYCQLASLCPWVMTTGPLDGPSVYCLG